MTAHEILIETVRMRGEDPDDATILSDYNAAALIGMNEGNRHICAAIVHPVAVEAVTLDENKRFAAADLTSSPKQILSVAKYEDYSESAHWRQSKRYDCIEVSNGTFAVPAADAEATVYVEYLVLPPDLVNTYPAAITGHAAGSDATSPDFIPEQYHKSLCYMALSKLAARDGQKGDTMFWEAEFYSSMESMSPLAPQTEVESYYVV